MMKKLVCILLILGSLAHAKKNVCTVTINSSEEKQAFQSQLDSQDFNFIELTELGQNSKNGNQDWFQTACSQNVSCDVLVISGHFGGSFFGRSKFSLGLLDLERNSCENRCPGILQKPREVFLLGCNTLASKDLDHRTPRQYFQTLVEHGIEPVEAERIVNARYSPIGSSNRDRMQRIFEGVPFIYGFSSVGPSGKHIRPSLKKYFDEVGDYKKHLESIESGELKSNDLFRKNMTAYTTAIVSGLKKDDPTYQVKRNSCQLMNEKTAINDRVELAGHLLEESPFVYFPTVAEFFSQSVDTNLSYTSKDRLSELVMRITGNTGLRDNVIKIANAGGFGATLQMDLIKLARTVRWISKDEYRSRVKKVLISLFNEPTLTSADTFCSIQDQYDVEGVNFKREDFPADHKFNRYQIRMLACSKTEDAKFTREILDAIKRITLSTIPTQARYEIFGALTQLPGFDDEITDFLLSQVGHDCQYQSLTCDDYLKLAITMKISGSRQIAFYKKLKSEFKNEPDFTSILNALIITNPRLEPEVETILLNDSYKNCPDKDGNCIVWKFSGAQPIQDWIAKNLDLKSNTLFADTLVQKIVREKQPIRLNANLASRFLERLLTNTSLNSYEYMELTTALGKADLTLEQLQQVRELVKSLVEKSQYYAAAAVRYILDENRQRLPDLKPEELRPAQKSKCIKRVSTTYCSSETWP